MDGVLRALQERAKELDCLYRVDEILRDSALPPEQIAHEVAAALPKGWQYPVVCVASVELEGVTGTSAGFSATPWCQTAIVQSGGTRLGEVRVHYLSEMPEEHEGPFLREERRLLEAVAARLAAALSRRAPASGNAAGTHGSDGAPRQDWDVILDLLRRTDQQLYARMARKMLNHLAWTGVEDAQRLLAELTGGPGSSAGVTEENRPLRRSRPRDAAALAHRVFRMASQAIGETEICATLQTWIKEDRLDFLVAALESTDTSLADIASALERYHGAGVDAREVSHAMRVGLKVALIRRTMTDSPDILAACQRCLEVDDFLELATHTILLPRSHGRIGGKSSGLFLARHALARATEDRELLAGVRVPRTWYLPSDGIVQFLAHNALDEVYNWKYRDLAEIRHEYPHMLQVFKSARFPAGFVQGVSAVLDDLGDAPLIVRSSSLLEDRAGSAFSGKYKSLFLANQGTKTERTAALLDAIAEVYASVFGPDPIQYRAERGLLEYHEEMGIMIQEVVGVRVGRYFTPAWAGVAFSDNGLRWSPRIRREDGLLRLVPGLGTRAVDRLADDYPVLAAPGQPGLRVNASPDDVARYSPRRVDVIHLKSNSFETVDRRTFLREVGDQLPGLGQMLSLYQDGMLRRPSGGDLRALEQDGVFTFDGLLTGSDFVPRMRAILRVLRKALGVPVDIEFASTGKELYLLQCRPQSHPPDSAPAPIPRDLPRERIVFSANRHISNGAVPDITHIVYVDPDGYAGLPELALLRDVGHAVGELNRILPKRQFILMGPGRWGSRGDIRLGVPVTYSDINNAAMLVEIARQKGNYVPDLSFGTHFFQDLQESGIRYLPLYPDDDGVVFDRLLLTRAESLLPRLLPRYAHLAATLRVIEVPAATDGLVLRVLLNADLDEAVGLLVRPESSPGPELAPPTPITRHSDDHSRWRLRMAQRIAGSLPPGRFGVQAVYVFGSTKNATAGPGSDVDLIVHFRGDEELREQLQLWLEGWSLCLAELNFLRTGYRSEGLLDVHVVTDEDLARRTSYAAKIGAITDAARPLALGKLD